MKTQYEPTPVQRLYRENSCNRSQVNLEENSNGGEIWFFGFHSPFTKIYSDTVASRFLVCTPHKLVSYGNVVRAMSEAIPGSFVTVDLCYDLPIIGSRTFRVRTPRPVCWGFFVERVSSAFAKYL